jgi:cytochrome c oxidase assembly factor CtaG
MSPLEDQNLGGVAMLGEGSVVTIAAFLWLLWKWMERDMLEQELIEAGVPPARAARATRYGRGQTLA